MKLEITFEPTKGVQVTGPINDKILAYGLLEAAKDAITEYHARLASEKRIVEAPSFFPNIRDRNGG